MDSGYFKFEKYLAFDGKVAFRYPVPVDKPPVSFQLYSNSEVSYVSCNSIRPSFYNFMLKHKNKIEEKYSVDIDIESEDHNVSLKIYGKESRPAIKDLFELCLNSNVYNFYICFPVVGGRFISDLDGFKSKYQDKFIGSNWERKPHITLKMLNVVTNDQLLFIASNLQSIAMQIQESSVMTSPYTLNLGPLDSFKTGHKKSSNAIFARTEFEDPIHNVSKSILEASAEKYNFNSDIFKKYDDEYEEEENMTIEDGSLYIHSFDARRDINHDGSKPSINNNMFLLGQNNDDNEVPLHPHVTLFRYDDYKEVIGLQGPKTGLVSTFELRPRHNENIYPCLSNDPEKEAISYNLIQTKNE